MGTSVQDPLDLDETGTVRTASSVPGWCLVVAAMLVAVLCLAAKGG